MNFKLIFAIIYFGLIAWAFILGRKSVYDNWFNDIKWQKYYLDEDGQELTEEEYLAKKEEENKKIDDLSPEEQMIALLAILENTSKAIDSLEASHPGITEVSKEILKEAIIKKR